MRAVHYAYRARQLDLCFFVILWSDFFLKLPIENTIIKPFETTAIWSAFLIVDNRCAITIVVRPAIFIFLFEFFIYIFQTAIFKTIFTALSSASWTTYQSNYRYLKLEFETNLKKITYLFGFAIECRCRLIEQQQRWLTNLRHFFFRLNLKKNITNINDNNIPKHERLQCVVFDRHSTACHFRPKTYHNL